MQDAVKEGRPTQDPMEDASEVCNIVANCRQLKRVRLKGFFAPGSELPAEVLTLVQTQGQRMDMAITVPGYVGGRLILVGMPYV